MAEAGATQGKFFDQLAHTGAPDWRATGRVFKDR
jgi:hypothetical protein